MGSESVVESELIIKGERVIRRGNRIVIHITERGAGSKVSPTLPPQSVCGDEKSSEISHR